MVRPYNRSQADSATDTLPGLHLRRQLPRAAARFALPEIFLWHRTQRLHELDGPIPHPQDGKDWRAGGPTDQRPCGGAQHNDTRERLAAAAG